MAKKNNYKKRNHNRSNNFKNNSQFKSETKNNELNNIKIRQHEDDFNVNKDFNSYVRNEDKSKIVNKARRELVYSSNDSTDEMSKLLKIVLIVTGIMIVFYGITTLITKRVNAVKTAKLGKSSEKVTIQYDSVIIGSMLRMDGHFYVLIEKEDDDNISEYDTLLKSIAANDEALKIYTADLSSSFNKKYFGKESNFDSDLNKFKVKDTTLIEVSDHKIEKTFEGYDSIKEKLDELK